MTRDTSAHTLSRPPRYARLIRSCVIVALVVASGCAGTYTDKQGRKRQKIGYVRARWEDLCDILPIGWGLSYGVIAKASIPANLTLGVGAARSDYRTVADRRYERRKDWQVGLPASPIWHTNKFGDCLWFDHLWKCEKIPPWGEMWGVTTYTTKTAGSEIFSASPIPSETWRAAARHCRLDVAVGVLGYLGLGVNFAELADFILGLTFIDMADDDAAVL